MRATCRGCKKPFPTTDLYTKQVRWRKSGPQGRVEKSKNIGHYCASCMKDDEQYNLMTRPEVRAHLMER